MAIKRTDFNNPGDIIAYLNAQSNDISPKTIETLYDILIDIEPTPQDLANFLYACANANVFQGADDTTNTTADIFKDIFGRYPDVVIKIARDEYGCDIPEDTVDPDTVFSAVVHDFYADDIYTLLGEAVEAAEGIIEPDNDEDEPNDDEDESNDDEDESNDDD